MKERWALLIAVIVLLVLCVGYLCIHHVKSETFALTGVEEKFFFYHPVKIDKVYQYDITGRIVEYEEGRDYLVNYMQGTIRRTEGSRIPNYEAHTVIYNNDGSFSFSSEPRNPELNIEYQVLVDYSTFLKPWRTVTPKEGLENTVNKLKNGEDIKILLCGDSIAAGAQTTGLYYFDDHKLTTFFGYLDVFLEGFYGINVDSVLFGENGASLQYMNENINQIVEMRPDVVLIEFGMNDHVVEEALVAQELFGSNLDSCVEKLQEHGIEVILIGFFQQNSEWEKENQKATKVYNDLIAQVADKYSIPFADIYKAFMMVDRKDIYEDLTSDYMHHPTDFGHMIYFSKIVPYFLDKSMREIHNYLY